MAQLLSGVKARGLTAASATIATVTVNYNSDGSWDFQDASGDTLVYNGSNAEVNKLLELMFVGTGGLATGTKLFGNT